MNKTEQKIILLTLFAAFEFNFLTKNVLLRHKGVQKQVQLNFRFVLNVASLLTSNYPVFDIYLIQTFNLYSQLK